MTELDASPPFQPEEPAAPAARQAPHPREGVLRPLQSLAVTVVIAIFVITFLVQAFQIPSESMEDTLLIGDYLLVDKVELAPHHRFNFLLPYREIHRDDIIVFRWPVHPEQHFVKRVIGVPGDRVRIAAGKVMVNGIAVEEPFAVYRHHEADYFRDNFPTLRISPQMTATWYADIPRLMRGNELLVPEGHYFVLGDNRNESLDSRYWGLVPRESIIGRPLVIYWSMKAPTPAELRLSPDDKIGRFIYTLRHLPALARWDRTLHFVK